MKLTAVAATPNKSTADSLHLRNAEQTNTDCPNGLACRYIPAAYTKLGIPARVRTPLKYAIPSGQVYVASELIQSSDYYAKLYNSPDTYKIVKGEEEFYQISFGHRIAFVKKSDVDLVNIPE